LSKFAPKLICVEFNPSIAKKIYFVQEKNMKIKQGSSARLEDIQNILFTNVSNGDILTYESSSGLWKNKQPSPKITVSATQPPSPVTGDIWFDIS
jgi:hypothetical protein